MTSSKTMNYYLGSPRASGTTQNKKQFLQLPQDSVKIPVILKS